MHNNPALDVHLARELRDALDFALKQSARHDLDTITLTVPRATEIRRRLASYIEPAKRAERARPEPAWAN